MWHGPPPSGSSGRLCRRGRLKARTRAGSAALRSGRSTAWPGTGPNARAREAGVDGAPGQLVGPDPRPTASASSRGVCPTTLVSGNCQRRLKLGGSRRSKSGPRGCRQRRLRFDLVPARMIAVALGSSRSCAPHRILRPRLTSRLGLPGETFRVDTQRLHETQRRGLHGSHAALIQSLWPNVYKDRRVLPADGVDGWVTARAGKSTGPALVQSASPN